MKIRTALISITVSGALVAGVAYAAYYTMQGQVSPVEVVPVKNVNDSWYGDYYYTSDTITGTVTSQVSQTVVLEEYDIEEIYVSEGEEVTVGTPLFSYDMTKEEIDLEAKDIELQTNELQLRRKQKELAKYQNTSATASLETTATTLTSSSGDAIIDESTEQTADGEAAEEGSEDTDGSGLEIEGIETVDPDENEDTVLLTSVTNYEMLMSALGELMEEFEGELTSEDVEVIGESLTKAVEFYREYLADEEERETTGEDGETLTLYYYSLKDSVKELLSSDEVKTLEACAALMEHYHAAYVDMLIEEAVEESGDSQKEAAEAARREYENLSGGAREDVTLLEELEALEAVLAAEGQTESETDASEPDTESGTAEEESDLEPDTDGEDMTETLPAQTETDTETGTTDAAESETETEAADATESETETGTTDATESETEAGTTGETESETETEMTDVTETEPESETESESAAEEIGIEERISSFLMMADAVLSETASPEAIDYQNAIAFYQMYLAVPPADIVDEDTGALMEEYDFSEETLTYLSALGSEGAALQITLTSTYQELCLAYVEYLVLSLDAQTMTREELTAAQEAYELLGTAWAIALDASAEDGEPCVSDYLTAYDIVLRIEELSAESETGQWEAAEDESEEESESETDDFLEKLADLYLDYLSLTDTQLALVWNADTLFELLELYGFLEEESESETDYYDDWDDDYYSDYDSDYTAEELKELIEELETEIKEIELEIRESTLELEQQQRVVDKKVVKSTVDGTVVTIGDEDGNTDDDNDYFVKITSSEGLYVKSAISERSLETVNVGDSISGVDYSGNSFTAVITEISEYPVSSSELYNYDIYSYPENTSYYLFYAQIDDPEGIEEGYADLTLSMAYAEGSDAIYLEPYFVRTDATGNNYVYVQGSDGTLELRYVTLGTSPDEGYIVKIIGGLSLSDKIAFPYGDNVYEGAKTEEVDSLEAAWG
ncbi:MAG: hypothetical protein LUD18_13970 [Lachnospiraceae bacterium]|nr:hypothetical protein [Lachnospiraceae bacterium]